MTNYKEVSSGESKQMLLDILSVIDNFCRCNNLNYYIAYGTLLGAIRHKGFIPWDDDIDIIMPRPDYNKFIQLFEHDIYKIYSQESNANWYLNYAKICDERTISRDHFGNESKLAVDLFILDGLPIKEKKIDRFFSFVDRLYSIWSSQLFTAKLAVDKKYGLVKNIKIVLSKVLNVFLPFKSYLKYMINAEQRYGIEGSKYCSVLCVKHDVFETSYMLDCIDVDFENLLVRAPLHYDYQLKLIYGDYMQLPPEDQRIAHGAKTFVQID